MTAPRKFKLSDFIDINPKVALGKGAKHSFVEMKDLNESQKYVLPSQMRELKGGARFQDGDTLFARITPCLENGKICQVKGLRDGVGYGSTEFLVFRGKENISNTDFIYYLSRYDVVRRFAEQNMVGTSGRQRVSKEAFENISLLLPDLPTQAAIAEILSSLDDKIELNNQINQELEALAQALFKHWFIDFEFPNEKGKPYKSSGGKMVVTDLEEIPKEWRIVSLADLMDFQGGAQPPSTVFEDEPKPGYVRLIQIRDYESELNATYVPDTSKLRKCDEYDIMIARYGASVARILWGLRGAYNVALVKVVPHNSIYREYLRVYLKTKPFQERLISMSGRSVQAGFNKDDFRSFRLIVPESDELFKMFDDLTATNFKLSLELAKENIALRDLRDTLLPRLISGELNIA